VRERESEARVGSGETSVGRGVLDGQSTVVVAAAFLGVDERNAQVERSSTMGDAAFSHLPALPWSPMSRVWLTHPMRTLYFALSQNSSG
jgi:hypothetical protein